MQIFWIYFGKFIDDHPGQIISYLLHHIFDNFFQGDKKIYVPSSSGKNYPKTGGVSQGCRQPNHQTCQHL